MRESQDYIKGVNVSRSLAALVVLLEHGVPGRMGRAKHQQEGSGLLLSVSPVPSPGLIHAELFPFLKPIFFGTVARLGDGALLHCIYECIL